MNVLITNPQEVQAYTIMRCLRPSARRIIVAEGEHSVGSTGFQGMTVYSRFVDSKYRAPPFAGDWLAGRLESWNTDAEEAYVQRIEEICRLESVDVIFPSLDPEVYLFAKNKQRFAKQGVVTVVPDPDVIRVPMDKGLTIQVAQRVGFPCPKTFFPDSAADLAHIAAHSEPPWIVKPRFTAHGANMVLVEHASELEGAYLKVSGLQHSPMVQEYIKGRHKQNYYVIVSRDGQILSLLSPRALRTSEFERYRISTKTAVSASTAPYLAELRSLLRELGLWGGYTVQTKIDPRDGIPKLLEINPRLGQHLWWRTGLGVNEPLICLQIARGETPTGDFRFRDGVMLLDPYFDFFALYSQVVAAIFRIVRRLVNRSGDRADSAAQSESPGIIETLRLYRRDYLNLRPKIFCPEVSNLLVDPYPCLQAFWFKFHSMTASHVRNISQALVRRLRRPRTA